MINFRRMFCHWTAYFKVSAKLHRTDVLLADDYVERLVPANLTKPLPISFVARANIHVSHY